jgi:hypothetical protein
MLPVSSLVPLALLVALILSASLQLLSASGHFPRAAHRLAPAGGVSPALLWGSILLVCGSVIVGVIAAWLLIPWYAAVIAGGLAILIAPLLLPNFSDRFVDGSGSLATFGGIAAVLAVLLAWHIWAA